MYYDHSTCIISYRAHDPSPLRRGGLGWLCPPREAAGFGGCKRCTGCFHCGGLSFLSFYVTCAGQGSSCFHRGASFSGKRVFSFRPFQGRPVLKIDIRNSSMQGYACMREDVVISKGDLLFHIVPRCIVFARSRVKLAPSLTNQCISSSDVMPHILGVAKWCISCNGRDSWIRCR